MSHDTDTNELKNAIEILDHKVRQIFNVKNRTTGNGLDLFFIDLEPKSNNKQIYQVKFLLNMKIQFEEPYKKNDIVQCKRCQRYGHTQNYCNRPFYCVKCGERHDTRSCTKPKTEPAKCALCEGPHPASYKGCPIRKEKMKKLNADIQAARNRNATAKQIPAEKQNLNPTKKGQTYAQVVLNQPDTSTENTTGTSLLDKILEKLEKLILDKLEHCLSTLVDKIVNILSHGKTN